jgi:hypothetical protein
MKINIPDTEVKITEKTVEKNWYDFFDDVYNKIIGYFDSSLNATLYKGTTQSGNIDGTETSIDNFKIRQTNLTANEIIEIFAGGTRASNGNNKTIRLKINSTTYYTNTVATSGESWQVRVKIINLGASQKIFIENGGISTYTTTSIDTSTTDFDLILTLQGVATNDIVKEYYEVKFDK